MTSSQYLHHQEQMEAARKEFAVIWLKSIQPKEYEYLVKLRGEAIYLLCWHTFVQAKGLSHD